MKYIFFKIFVLGLLVLGCSDTEVNQDPSTDITLNDDITVDYSLLFIGNSLTATNNLPFLVKQKALESDIIIETTQALANNFGLEDHWEAGNIQNMIATQQFDFVIIQQGPSSQAYGRSSLIEFGGYIKNLCEANGAELAYFMVWPSLTYYNTFPGVIQNYTDAASFNGARLCPVGTQWRSYINQTNDYSYYGPDGFHPSLAGSKIAAEVILQSLNIL